MNNNIFVIIIDVDVVYLFITSYFLKHFPQQNALFLDNENFFDNVFLILYQCLPSYMKK